MGFCSVNKHVIFETELTFKFCDFMYNMQIAQIFCLLVWHIELVSNGLEIDQLLPGQYSIFFTRVWTKQIKLRLLSQDTMQTASGKK
jgi:hypothetical protein